MSLNVVTLSLASCLENDDSNDDDDDNTYYVCDHCGADSYKGGTCHCGGTLLPTAGG